jgi:hypothetical protein
MNSAVKNYFTATLFTVGALLLLFVPILLFSGLHKTVEGQLEVSSTITSGECEYLGRWVPVKALTFDVVNRWHVVESRTDSVRTWGQDLIFPISDKSSNNYFRNDWLQHLHGFRLLTPEVLAFEKKISSLGRETQAESEDDFFVTSERFLNAKKKMFGSDALQLAEIVQRASDAELEELNPESRYSFSSDLYERNILIPSTMTVCRVESKVIMSGALANYEDPVFGKLRLLEDATVPLEGEGRKTYAERWIELRNMKRVIGRLF